MALNRMVLSLRLLVIALAAPALCFPAAISINGICKSGDCSHPGALAFPATDSRPFLFTYTFLNTDSFKVSGSYSTTNLPAGTGIVFTVIASYIGNITHTPSSADTLNVDLLQNYLSPFSLDGTYSYSSSGTLGPTFASGSYIDTVLTYEGQSVGEIGPFIGTGNHTGTSSATLTGLTNPLTADFRYTFFFAAGSIPSPNLDASSPESPTAGVVGSARLESLPDHSSSAVIK